MGGATAIATVSRPNRQNSLKAGADHIINYKTEDVVERKEITGAADGRGIDRVVDVNFAANLPVTTAVVRSNRVITSYSSGGFDDRPPLPNLPAQQHHYSLRPRTRCLPLMLGCIISQPIPTLAAELSALSPALHASENSVRFKILALLYLNAQNLVDTWNNIIIQAKTGDEQLKLMRESGIFADENDI